MVSKKKTVKIHTEPVCAIIEVRSIEVLHGDKVVGELDPAEVERLRMEYDSDFDIGTIRAVFSIVPDYDLVVEDNAEGK